jgi:large subunit ribosomal protein L10
MRTGSQVYSKKKTKTLQKLKEYSQKNDVIAISKIRKVRARQMMALRKQLRKELFMIVAKNKISNMGLIGVKENIDNFLKKIKDQNALIFTNMNPFKLQLLLEKNKIDLPARAGDIATSEVIIPAGNTGMAPGPVLSEFKEMKVPTKIDAGSIFVTKDSPVLNQGEIISSKLASLLSRLDIKPIKAGLALDAAYMDGLIFSGDDLRINLNEYLEKIKEFYQSVINLGVEASYLTPETTPLILSKANRDARALSLETGYISKDSAKDVLDHINLKATALLNQAKNKGYK